MLFIDINHRLPEPERASRRPQRPGPLGDLAYQAAIFVKLIQMGIAVPFGLPQEITRLQEIEIIINVDPACIGFG